MHKWNSWFMLLAASLVAIPVMHAEVDFGTDVAPLLRDYCAGCHNDQDLEAELSVETFHALNQGGESEKTMIVPGRPEESYLIQVLTGEAKPKMPPKRETQMEHSQIDVLVKWVEEGATGPERSQDTSILKTLSLPPVQPSQEVKPIVTAAEFSGDGKWLVRGGFGFMAVASMPDLSEQWETNDIPGKVGAVHLRGNRVIVASGVSGLRGEASVWDLRTGDLIRRFDKGHNDLLYDADLSPDGTILATAGYDRVIRFWNLESGEEVLQIDGHYGAVFDLTFHPSGKLIASASADQTIKIWRVADGVRIDTLNQPQGEQYKVAFTPDGQFILGVGADRRIRMWEQAGVDTPILHPVKYTRFAHEGAIVDMTLSPDGTRLITSSADRSIKVWSLPDLNPLHAWESESDVAQALGIPNGGEAALVHFMDGSHAWKDMPKAMSGQENPVLSKTLEPSSAGSAGEPLKQEKVAIQSNGVNQEWTQAQQVTAPVEITGILDRSGKQANFRFHADAGQTWVVEVDASQSGSPLDSRIEILDEQGNLVERVRLQALRDSWFTFRGKDSTTSGDFRLQNWREMELNEYLYSNGEVNRLWLYPRGPDSGFLVYPGFGNRHTYFGTTAITHALGEPCYIVRPVPAGIDPAPNGLPVFPIYYQNDDDPYRKLGKDSKLIFEAPGKGEYIVRLSDVRGFGGNDFRYRLTVRPPKPGFTARVEGWKPEVSPGSGREFMIQVERHDNFQGPIRIEATHVPEGFSISTPILVQAEQHRAFGAVYLLKTKGTANETPEGEIGFKAIATINGKTVEQNLEFNGNVKTGSSAKIQVEVLPLDESEENDGPLELTIAPGETISARVRIQRNAFDARVPFGNEDAGRNLPHGLYVDNIGLNGLMIVEGQTEREFFITAAKWAPETTRVFHLRTTEDGGQCSQPVILHVKQPE